MTNDPRIEELEKENHVLRKRLAALEPYVSMPEQQAVQRLLGERIVLENIPDVICILNRENRILYLNRTVPGKRVEDMLGTIALEYMHEQHRARYLEAFEDAWLTGTPRGFEVQTVSGFWWETRLTPVKNNEAVVFMLGTSIDISQRKLSEEALRESESRLRHAIEASGMGTWTWDRRTDEFSWDATLCTIFGIRGDSVPRGYDMYLAMVHPDDRDEIAAAVVRYLKEGAGADLQHRIVRPDGEVRHVLAKATTLRDSEGEIVGFRGGVFDVTEQKRLEEQLRQVQKMDAIGQLTAGIAHNFNNLLSVILPNVSLCRARSHPDVHHYLADIEHAATRAAEMVRQLMLFARPDAKSKKTAIDVVEAARRTAEICVTTFDRKISIDLEAAPRVPIAAAHAGQIEQVLLNIFLNARDAFALAETEAPRIRIRVDRGSQGTVRIRVTDNGPGMDEATRSRVFEPFFTTKAVGRGTGLGLAGAYAIVMEHHGRFCCESRLGEGSTFEIELPAAEALPPEPDGTRAHSFFARGEGTVLLIDDEPLVRRAVRGILEQQGYRVLESVDGVDGLAVYERHREEIDIVVLDQSMPGLSGDQVLPRLLELDARLPVLFLSGLPGPAARLGQVIAVFTKPPDAHALLSAIRDGIAWRREMLGRRS